MIAKDPDTTAALYAKFPSRGRDRFLVRYTTTYPGFLSDSFAEAARRVAATVRGAAPDDRLLVPYVYLYRHAIELALKNAIVHAAAARRRLGEDSPDLARAKVQARLASRDRGHKLPALLDELREHLAALEVEQIPESTDSLIRLLADADPDGQRFRYDTPGPNEQTYIAFDDLTTALDEALTIVGVTQDVIDVRVEGWNALAEYADYDS